MSALYIASYVLLWILVAVLTLLVLLLYRQYGRTIMGPLERINNSGLSIGEKLTPLSAHAEDGQLFSINWHDAADGTAVLFAASGCPLCDRILSEKLLDVLAAKWEAVRFIWIDGDASEERPLSVVESETHLGRRQVAARGETPDVWLG